MKAKQSARISGLKSSIEPIILEQLKDSSPRRMYNIKRGLTALSNDIFEIMIDYLKAKSIYSEDPDIKDLGEAIRSEIRDKIGRRPKEDYKVDVIIEDLIYELEEYEGKVASYTSNQFRKFVNKDRASQEEAVISCMDKLIDLLGSEEGETFYSILKKHGIESHPRAHQVPSIIDNKNFQNKFIYQILQLSDKIHKDKKADFDNISAQLISVLGQSKEEKAASPDIRI
jgi:hypothetical protein